MRKKIKMMTRIIKRTNTRKDPIPNDILLSDWLSYHQ